MDKTLTFTIVLRNSSNLPIPIAASEARMEILARLTNMGVDMDVADVRYIPEKES